MIAELKKDTNEMQLQEHLAAIVQFSDDAITSISMDGVINYWNDGAQQIFGYSSDEVLGKSIDILAPSKTDEHKDILEKYNTGKKLENFETKRIKKDGSVIDVSLTISPIFVNSKTMIGFSTIARDVTIRAQYSQFHRTLFEASRDPLVIIGIEGKIADMNQATVNITGIEREKLMGSDFFEYFTEPQKAREVYQEIFTKGFVSDYPLTIRNKEGKLTDVLFSGSVYKDDRGNVLRVVIVARDITAQKLLSKYSLSIIEASRDPLVTISTEGKITGMNQATVNYTGIEREKLIGSDFLDYFTEPLKAREVYKEVFAKGSVADFPLTLQHKSGKLTDVLFNGSVYKDDRGNVLGVVVVARDVTAQKLLSKYSLSLIEASRDPLVTINAEGKITDMNEATVNITGIERGKLIGSDFFDYFTEPQKAREVYQEVFIKDFVADSPLTLRHKDGKLTDVLFNGSVYKDDRGNVLGVVIVARDVTDKKIAEAKLKKKSEELERSNKELEQFAYIASHDLQAPLRMVSSYLQLLEKRYKDKLDKDANEFINFAVDGSNRMRTLISSLLDYSRINRVKPFEDINLNELLKEVLGDLKTDVIANKAVITIEMLPDIFGDKVLIGELFQNLISNAVKFKGERNPEILISGKKNEDEYLFFVKDNGIGIQKEYASKLFIIFQRLNTEEQYPGTGIGLAICKKIVERHGGKIWFESEFGKGTTFYFTIKGKQELRQEQTKI
jgi:PAS domain S-box-containing protein